MRAWQKIEYSFYRIVVYPRKERERKERKEREEERKEQTKKGMFKCGPFMPWSQCVIDSGQNTTT